VNILIPPRCAAARPRPGGNRRSSACTIWLLIGLLSLAAAWGAQAPANAAEAELERLARALRPRERTLTPAQAAAAYERLRAFAEHHARGEAGIRAALALGYHDHTAGRNALARQWLDRAARHPLLREYALYWGAQADRGLGENAAARSKLETLLREFPGSVLTEQATEALARTLLVLGEANAAARLLDGYGPAAVKPALLLLWAQALEQGSGKGGADAAAAARLYREVYYRFPLSDEASVAARRLSAADRARGDAAHLGRAAAFFGARRWREACAEYGQLEDLLEARGPGRELEEVRLRRAQCRVQIGAAGPALVAGLSLADAELETERLYVLSQLYRARGQETEMLAAIEQAASRRGRWAEEALFAAGNYYWVALDRARAAGYYRRVLQHFPAGTNARVAHWRIAWAAHLEGSHEAAAMFEEHVRAHPHSPSVPNALYWLGRLAERAGNVPHARNFYLALLARFPETYFGMEASRRMAALGAGPANPAEAVPPVPPAQDLPPLNAPVPAAAAAQWARARALRSIAFDASAEFELRAAHAAASAPRLLVEAARAAFDAGRYPAAISAARQAVPQLEARRVEDGPAEIWRLVYPLPYAPAIEREAKRRGLDPMLIAGLIRQESTFQPDAVSRAGAVGLMQVVPTTGQRLARRLRLPYSRRRLAQPEYNLRLGTAHLAVLLEQFPALEEALAAYNAGENRVAAWRTERAFAEPAEFVESIPFTETREYVMNVMRNAEVYRRLYGSRP
jgi:soluble lytic murein transglycosylase